MVTDASDLATYRRIVQFTDQQTLTIYEVYPRSSLESIIWTGFILIILIVAVFIIYLVMLNNGVKVKYIFVKYYKYV